MIREYIFGSLLPINDTADDDNKILMFEVLVVAGGNIAVRIRQKNIRQQGTRVAFCIQNENHHR